MKSSDFSLEFQFLTQFCMWSESQKLAFNSKVLYDLEEKTFLHIRSEMVTVFKRLKIGNDYNSIDKAILLLL